MILGLLKLRGIKALRLSSRTCTNVGAQFLFKPLVFRLDRDDFSSFHRATKDPLLKAGIDSVTFGIGSLDIYNVTSNFSYKYVPPTKEHAS
jgi:hypothetical protein